MQRGATIILLIILISDCFLIRAQNSWIQKADIGGNGRGGAAAFVINGKGYVGTGIAYTEGYSKTFWEYDPIADSWSQKADLPGEGRAFSTAFSIENKGYIGTGLIDDNIYTDDFWEYDAINNMWLQMASLTGGKRAGSFSLSIGGKGYIGGGLKGVSAKDDFWEYDPATDQWTQKADYGGGKVWGAVAFVISDKGYCGTGVDNSGEYRNDFWQYDPLTDSWTQKTDLPAEERVLGIGCAIADLGYLGLGATLDTTIKYLGDFWEYDPSTDSWTKKADYPGEPGDARVAISLEQKGYVGTAGTSANEWWEYTPGFAVGTAEVETKTGFSVHPNPFSFSATVSITLLQSSVVTLELCDLAGRKIKALLNKTLGVGRNEVGLYADELIGGIYFLKLKSGNETSTIKLVIQ